MYRSKAVRWPDDYSDRETPLRRRLVRSFLVKIYPFIIP